MSQEDIEEMPGVYDEAQVLKTVGGDRGELQMSFNFAIVDLNNSDGVKFKRRDSSSRR